ncbi:hypothetical protein pdam_00011061 [Pocillopora damicornis]|uniref:Uncharacterized protein n=1 Tax=Pocillopora damicornis TaxID=46731 RepID=A0A3M6UTG3_POCDA|nr:hypothetical protein pdam_00011061 [Pocillopora damicornis]
MDDEAVNRIKVERSRISWIFLNVINPNVKNSLHKDVSKGIYGSVTIIWVGCCIVTTCQGFTSDHSCTKPKPGISTFAILFVVAYDADSCPRMTTV